MKHLDGIVPGDPIPFTTPPPPPPPPRSASDRTEEGAENTKNDSHKGVRKGQLETSTIHWFNSARKGYSREKVTRGRSRSRSDSAGPAVTSQNSFDSSTLPTTTRTLHCPLPQWFSFVLTEANGDYTYGVSLTFYEPATILVAPPMSLFDGIEHRCGKTKGERTEAKVAAALSRGGMFLRLMAFMNGLKSPLSLLFCFALLRISTKPTC